MFKISQRIKVKKKKSHRRKKNLYDLTGPVRHRKSVNQTFTQKEPKSLPNSYNFS